MTKNPANGKKERVFVDLQAVYPSPEEPGTELSFEEVWAANRGWLDQTWGDESAVNFPDENSPPAAAGTGLSGRHDVVTLDENGRIPEKHRDGRGRKKKVMEVNETQISTWSSSCHIFSCCGITNTLQSKQSWTRHPVPRYGKADTGLNQP